jgi:hypothetical protein
MVATGHYRNGILLAPVTATEVLRLVEANDGRSAAGPSPFDDFRPDRFLASDNQDAARSVATSGHRSDIPRPGARGR